MITADDKIADVIKRYPFIKKSLIARNKIYSNLNNPFILKAVTARGVKIKDVTGVSGENLEDFLLFLNTEIKKNGE
ncbi:MAG: hypothetical protein CSA94_00300 [Bacteroidetes bacterium]|nr:MAG: hypothetical protein CSA94_00300 [Bacteroidota bacterium]